MSVFYDGEGNQIIIGGNGEPTLKVPWASSMHRGYTTSSIHENTLPAFYRTFLNGAEWIEVDARLSSDSVYVCNHDATVKVGGVTYTIAETLSSVLTDLVLSTDSTYGNCYLPTLESVLKLCLYTGMYANIDCKDVNPATIAQLVVDTGMSGRVAYANLNSLVDLSTTVSTILSIDPNAGFIFSYSDAQLARWITAIDDYNVRSRSYTWSQSISYEALEEVRATGFKYMLISVNSTTDMSYAPDMIEFASSANCDSLNSAYLNSLNLLT